MIDEVHNRFQAIWSPNQQMTVDEEIIMYKGKYCPIRKYMPKKPIRFGIKVWTAAEFLDSVAVLAIEASLSSPCGLLVFSQYTLKSHKYLESNGTMAISTLRENKKYVPRAMLSYKKKGNWLDRLQNASRNKSILSGLKDKQPVVLLSTHADAVPSRGNGNLYGANLGAIGRKSI